MKVIKSLLLGSAAGMLSVAAAQAADLPTRKAAPVEYVRVCNAYGAGFFYIPGTDTCLKVGGLVLAQLGIQPSSALYTASASYGAGLAVGGIGTYGAYPSSTSGSGYRTVFGREVLTHTAIGRVELDARTQSPWGTVRTFIRVESQFGSSANATTGSLASGVGINFYPTSIGATVSKEVTYLNKAFIQFAGITAGRVQSFFDFYADAINYEGLRGSNQTAWALAYTATFGGGFSASLSLEDASSHRGIDYSVIAAGGLPGTANFGIGAGGLVATPGLAASAGNERIPDVVGNLRIDQPWGSAQLSGAVHNVRANLFSAAAATSGTTGGPAAYGFPIVSSSSIGFAVQGGLQFNLDSLAPGDKLWLQATYAKGAIGYVSGNNLALTGGFNSAANYGTGLQRMANSPGWQQVPDADCVFTYSGACEKSSAFAIVAALKHYWTPTLSSGFFGQYYRVTYTQNALVPISPFTGDVRSVGLSNYQETKVGTNLVWTPVKGFDIGAEFAWIRGIAGRPVGLQPDVALNAVGLPSYKSTTDQYSGKLRMIRAF